MTETRSRAVLRSAVLLTVLTLAFGLMLTPVQPASAAVPRVQDRNGATVSALALPTAQINGVAWAQAVVGNTVYVGGSFSSARPAGSAAGSNEVPRTNVLAYSITTGVLVPSFAPKLNGQVKAITVSPDRTRIYLGGDFTVADGVTVNRIAAYSVATGKLITTFKAGLNGPVAAIAATAGTVYVAGTFSTAGSGTARTRLAAFNASTGGLTAWAPRVDDAPSALVLTPDQKTVVVGGRFTHVNTAAAQGVGAVSAATGSALAWPVNKVIHNGNTKSGIFSLSVDTDTIYASNWNYGTGNFEGIFATSTAGAVKWLADCHGDTYAVYSMNNVVYDAGHAHTCANIGGFGENNPRWNWRSMAFSKTATGTVATNNQSGAGYGNFAGQPAPSVVYWFPQFTIGTVTNLEQAVWSLTGNGKYLLAGGEFPAVNGKPQHGLVRFAVPGDSSDPALDSGPTQLGGVTNPVLTQVANPSSSPGASPSSASSPSAGSSSSPSGSASPTATPSPSPSPAQAVKITWTANWDRDDRRLTYKLVRSDRGTSEPISVQNVASTFWSLPTLTFTDSSVISGQTYRYRVYEYDPNDTTTPGTYSDYVSITVS